MPRRLAHDALEQRAELDVGGDLRDDLDEFHLLRAQRLHPLDELPRSAAPSSPCVVIASSDVEVVLREVALALVQHLRDADDFALRRSGSARRRCCG